MHSLLADDGSIFVHCDSRLNSSLRLILDELFGSKNYLAEIIWRRSMGHFLSDNLDKVTDNIFWYGKSENFLSNTIYED